MFVQIGNNKIVNGYLLVGGGFVMNGDLKEWHWECFDMFFNWWYLIIFGIDVKWFYKIDNLFVRYFVIFEVLWKRI